MSSCANLGDSSTQLGNGYSYQVDGGFRWIGSDHTMKDRIYSNVIDYAFNDAFIIAIQEPSIKGYTELLSQDLFYRYSFILTSKDTSNYEINTRRFLRSYMWEDSGIHKRMLKIMQNNQSTVLDVMPVADSILKNDPFYHELFLKKQNYWIIDKRNNEVLGPFNKYEFLNVRNKLGVPASLQLNSKRNSL